MRCAAVIRPARGIARRVPELAATTGRLRHSNLAHLFHLRQWRVPLGGYARRPTPGVSTSLEKRWQPESTLYCVGGAGGFACQSPAHARIPQTIATFLPR